MASRFGIPLASREIAVDEDGVIHRHPVDTLGDGTLKYQHFEVENEGGDTCYFKHGDATLTVANVALPVTLLAYFTPTNAADVTTYRATLAAANFDYISSGGDGDADILAGMLAVIDADPLYNAEIEGTRLAVRSVDDTPFTAAQSTPVGAGTLTLAEPVKGAENAIANGSINDEWTEGEPRTAFVCAATQSTTLIIRYFGRKSHAPKPSR